MLECFVESYPRANIYWNKDDQMPPIMHSDKKYEINIKESSVPYRFVAKYVFDNTISLLENNSQIVKLD